MVCAHCHGMKIQQKIGNNILLANRNIGQSCTFLLPTGYSIHIYIYDFKFAS